MDESVGLYNISPKMPIVEECNSDADSTNVDINDVDIPQLSDKILSWVDIVMKNKKSLGNFTRCDHSISNDPSELLTRCK